MPHQCIRCGTLHADGSQNIVKGCSCGSKFFFYIRKQKIEEAKKITEDLTETDRVQIEKDVQDIVGDKIEEDQPIFLDLESVNVSGPGKYEIDLVDLFRKRPLIYKLEEGKYLIDIVSTFDSKDLEEKHKKAK
tara:strand:+ start:3925 stop:4323 length:399 start_codon:yes stop_codon:yes gene_type:complete